MLLLLLREEDTVFCLTVDTSWQPWHVFGIFFWRNTQHNAGQYDAVGGSVYNKFHVINNARSCHILVQDRKLPEIEIMC